MTLIANATGWVEVVGERVADAGAGVPPRTPDERHDGPIARGLVDLQVNGAAGVAVTDGPEALDRIDRLLLSCGVTSYLAAVPTTDDETLARTARDVAERVADPASPLEGLHLEGPFLDPQYAGVHRRELLRTPDDGVPDAYGSPAVRLVTLAPELPGALRLIGDLTARGVAVAIGHTGCDTATARAALDRGATLFGHVFNAMRPLHHREPGPVAVALVDDRAHVAVIADGVHVDPLVLQLIHRAAGPRVVLVSDATPAAGAPPGDYAMAGVPVTCRADGRALGPAGVLAGSALTLDEAVRRWCRFSGASPASALAAAGARPAALLGLPASLAPGSWADLVLLDDRAAVVRTMRRGRWA